MTDHYDLKVRVKQFLKISNNVNEIHQKKRQNYLMISTCRLAEKNVQLPVLQIVQVQKRRQSLVDTRDGLSITEYIYMSRHERSWQPQYDVTESIRLAKVPLTNVCVQEVVTHFIY